MKRLSLFTYCPHGLGSKFGILFLLFLFLPLSNSVWGQVHTNGNDTLSQTSVKQEVKEESNIFINVDPSPQFPGGEAALLKFIEENLCPFPGGVESDITGRVTLSFIVEADGTLTHFEVMRSPAKELSEEALRVVKLMPKWLPATQNGKPVRIRYVLPIIFRPISQTTEKPRSRNRFRQLATLYIASL